MIEPLVVVVDSDREHALGVVLADHIVVENGANLHRRRDAVAGLHQARFVLFANDVHAQLNAFIADEYGRAGDELANLVLTLAAERAVKSVFRVGSAHFAHALSRSLWPKYAANPLAEIGNSSFCKVS